MNTRTRLATAARALAYNAARALPVYPGIPARITAVLGAAWLLAAWAGAPFTGALFALAAGVAIASTSWWLVREVLPAQTTRGTVKRRGDREQRAGGVASIWDVMERASSAALRRKAHILRPSLRAVPWWRRSARDVGFLLARSGLGLRWGQQLWTSSEDTTLRVGGPRTGKTLSLACHGLDAPGALITTSTRLDLAEHVHQVRRVHPDTVLRRRTWRTLWITRRPDWSTGRERAVHIFNPTGFGRVPSSVTWSILVDCENYSDAARRAADLLPESRSVEGERWDRMARTFLPVLLYGAALLPDGSVADVLRWISQLSQDGLRDLARRELVSVLIGRRDGAQLVDVLDAFMSAPDKGRGSALLMMTTALGWMSDDVARKIGDAPRHTITLNTRQLILDAETLHIIGQSQMGGLMAPLTSAIVAEVAHQARQLASEMPGGRLDPPLTMLLDEAAVATRLPLDEWSADFGGRGVTLHMSVQSLSQLHHAWGHAGGAVLLGNTGSLLVFGGGMDADELAKISELCGDRWRRVVTEDTKILKRVVGVQRGEWEKVRVLTVAQLTNMPPGQAAVLKRNLGGVFVGSPPQVLGRRGWTTSALGGTVLGRRGWTASALGGTVLERAELLEAVREAQRDEEAAR